MGSASVSDPLLLQYFKTQVRKSYMKVILKFADAILRTKFSIAITDFFCLPAIFRAELLAVRFRAPSARSPNQSNSFCAPAAIYPACWSAEYARTAVAWSPHIVWNDNARGAGSRQSLGVEVSVRVYLCTTVTGVAWFTRICRRGVEKPRAPPAAARQCRRQTRDRGERKFR